MDIEEVVLDNPEIEESLPDIPLESIPAEEIPAPKKARAKGRPAGAKNKESSKPRTKKVIFQEPIDTPQYEYEPSSPRRNLPIPEYGVNDVAVEMLRLLSDQQNAKQERKRQLYASWFN